MDTFHNFLMENIKSVLNGVILSERTHNPLANMDKGIQLGILYVVRGYEIWGNISDTSTGHWGGNNKNMKNTKVVGSTV
jgi:hypothetical protein